MNRFRCAPLAREPLHAPGPGSSPAGDGHGGQPLASTHGFAPSRPLFPLTPFKRMALWSHFAWVTVLSTVMLFCCLFLLIAASSDFHHIAVRPRQCVISGTENPLYDLTAGFLWFHSTASSNSLQLFTHSGSCWSSRTCDEERCFQNACNVVVSFTRGTAMTLLFVALSQLWSLGIVYRKFTWKRQLPVPCSRQCLSPLLSPFLHSSGVDSTFFCLPSCILFELIFERPLPKAPRLHVSSFGADIFCHGIRGGVELGYPGWAFGFQTGTELVSGCLPPSPLVWIPWKHHTYEDLMGRRVTQLRRL
jgi:hypothetical protein